MIIGSVNYKKEDTLVMDGQDKYIWCDDFRNGIWLRVLFIIMFKS